MKTVGVEESTQTKYDLKRNDVVKYTAGFVSETLSQVLRIYL